MLNFQGVLLWQIKLKIKTWVSKGTPQCQASTKIRPYYKRRSTIKPSLSLNNPPTRPYPVKLHLEKSPENPSGPGAAKEGSLGHKRWRLVVLPVVPNRSCWLRWSWWVRGKRNSTSFLISSYFSLFSWWFFTDERSRRKITMKKPLFGRRFLELFSKHGGQANPRLHSGKLAWQWNMDLV